MIFKEVKNKEEMKVFLDISKKGWDENQWAYEVVKCEDVRRFLVKGEQGNYIGTFEIMPFQPEKGTVINDVFLFSQHPEVIAAKNDSLYELDKLTVLKEYRGLDSIVRMFEALIEVGDAYNINKYLTLPRHSFFRMIKRLKIPVRKLGEEFFYEPDDSKFVPIIIDIEDGRGAVEGLRRSLSVEVFS